MTERKSFSSDAPWESVAGYSRAVRIGKTIEVAGTTAVDSQGQIVSPGDAGSQTKFIFKKIDKILIELDGSENKTNLGANATLAVSLAYAKCTAISNKQSLYKSLGKSYSLPIPLMNIINGGAHADNDLNIQEFMIRPDSAENFTDAVEKCFLVIQNLKKLLQSKKMLTNVGDEGGFAPNFSSSKEVLDEIMLSIAEAGYKPDDQISLALDAAASEFYKDGHYIIEGNKLTNTEMSDYLVDLTSSYPIISIEDGLAEDDWDGWKYLTSEINASIQLVGDDLFVTQEKILQKGIDEKCGNAILIKVNQVGTITETLDAMKLASNNSYSSCLLYTSDAADE